MQKILHLNQTKILYLPHEVVDVIKSVASILDTEYGKVRDSTVGGYILIIEQQSDLKKLSQIYVNLDECIPEYVDEITCDNLETWLNVLILMNNDYGITLIMKMQHATPNILSYLN